MQLFNFTDITFIIIYLLLITSFGFILKKKASKSIYDYFLGANKLPWWAMGISGMSSFLDMAGTMLIVSFLYMLGPKGLYIEFRGGAALILTFMLLWSGKWHYRSKVITGAEWMIFRFGDSWGGQYARIISSVAVIITTIGMLTYLIKALGMFMTMFLPFSPAECSFVLISIATLYTILSGFYGVVYTDLFQSLIIISAIVFITTVAVLKISEVDNIANIAASVTDNADWATSKLSWQVDMPKGYEAYKDLILLMIFYLLRNMFIGVSSAGADPKYFGARNERECSSLTFLWMSLMMLRWPMMISFAVLGILMVNNLFHDQSVLLQTAELIKLYLPEITKHNWQETIANIVNHPNNFSGELIKSIKALLHDDWQTKLKLLSFEGSINTENIVPAVILHNFPKGVRGFFFIAFIAAAFSSLNSSLNKSAGYFTRDIYQRYIRPKAQNNELIISSYIFILLTVIISFITAYKVHSINQIWGWIAMGLGGGLAIPSALLFYWWRYNGSGYAIGTMTGILTAIIQFQFFPNLSDWLEFSIISVISLFATVIGTFLTKPTDEKVLHNFYKLTKPFGLWKPFKNKLQINEKYKIEQEHKYDLIALPFMLVWQITLFLLPMQLIIKNYNEFLISLFIFTICSIGIYYFWFKKLPPKTNLK